MNKSILTVGCLLLFTSAGFCQQKNFIDQPYIEVSGIADTLVTPDQIFIKIVISEKDNKDKLPVEEMERKMVAVFSSLGINTEMDLTTSDMLSNYRYYLLKKKDILKSKEYILKVSNAALASKVFIQLEELGLSNASIDRVDHTDIENISNVCRTKAILNAKTKAVALTKPLGQAVGNAMLISDNNPNLDNLLRARAGVGYYSDSENSKVQIPKIDFEKIKVMSAVSVKFMLK